MQAHRATPTVMPIDTPAPPAQPANPAPPALAEHSRFVQRVRRRYAQELTLLPPLNQGVLDAKAITSLVQALMHQGRALPGALRVARQLVIERLAVLDLEHAAPLDTITHTMTALAEATLEMALVQARRDADERHGPPHDAQGQDIDFWVVGMGKLGARELNVSSDIDLIYVYEEAGQTAGPRPTSAHEYFAFVAKRLYALIGDTTEDGFVFRVDLALRPNGNSGPPVASLAMLEDYFQVQGREWERFAWLKSRVVAPHAAVASGRTLALRALVKPFVFRRYLDYGVFESLRQLHRKIRDEAQRRAAGRPERANDVKLSRGGIREIEFIVQLMQVVRGGQYPELRTRSTLAALKRLVHLGLMPETTAAALSDAYTFLRRVEHRIQYLDDQQTHLLPTQDGDLEWTARSLGLACDRVSCALLDRLGEVRERVAREFDALLSQGADASADRADSGDTGDCRTCHGGAGAMAGAIAGATTYAIDNENLTDAWPAEFALHVRTFAAQARVAQLRDESRARLGRLMQRVALGLDQGQWPMQAALRFVDWVEPLLRRESYLALLAERPQVQARLLRLLGLARWPMQYLMRHPGVIDELADTRLNHQRFERGALMAELEQRRSAWARSGEADEERLLDTLRRAHHAEVFRTLVRDVEGEISVEQVADDLSSLADTLLDITLQWAWQRFKPRHREQPALAVVAYGKLGGKELGYGSDLDVVFVYDDRDEPDKDRALDIYGGFVRKLITWLTLHTAAGDLFDIDTALRPNGSSGLLVTSLSAFEHYQKGRGSNTAWAWEHQAITRARWCAGSAALAEPLEAVRRAVLCAPREGAAMRAEIAHMRERVRKAHPVRAGLFDVKHGVGGMMDVEFAVQALVLAQAASHETLLDNVGNIALLQRAESAGLLPSGVGSAAADAYRSLRRAQHQARLDEQPTQVQASTLSAQQSAVNTLWKCVFN